MMQTSAALEEQKRSWDGAQEIGQEEDALCFATSFLKRSLKKVQSMVKP